MAAVALGTWTAHGIGGRDDLPLPLGWAAAGATAAVVVSFVALGLLWRTPRLDGARAGRPLPPRLAALLDSTAARTFAAAMGLLAFAYLVSALALGSDDTRNPLPWLVYVLLWVGLVPVSVALGPLWRRVDPIRAMHALLHRALGLDPAEGIRPLPSALGYWPAAVGLFAFTGLELVAPDNTSLDTLRLAVGVHVVVQLFAGIVFGSGWYDRGEPFEVWSALFGRLSPVGRRADGVLVVRNPLAGLDALAPAPGLVATVAVMLGSTAYDGLSGTTWWTVRVQSSSVPGILWRSGGLLGCIVVLAGVFVACTVLAGIVGGASPAVADTGAVGGDGPGARSLRRLPGLFAPSVVPVALGYVVAHYYSFLVVEGQRAFIVLSDPWGTGADVLGTGDLQPSYAAVAPGLVVAVQVLAIVVGHVLGVVVAHERAVQLFPVRRAVVGQLPLLALMVALTCTGLFLLFAG